MSMTDIPLYQGTAFERVRGFLSDHGGKALTPEQEELFASMLKTLDAFLANKNVEQLDGYSRDLRHVGARREVRGSAKGSNSSYSASVPRANPNDLPHRVFDIIARHRRQRTTANMLARRARAARA